VSIATGDINNDGWPDVYMTHFGNDQLFLNQAGQGFENVTESAGISNPYWGTLTCFVDYNRDGSRNTCQPVEKRVCMCDSIA
jgi:enediyne biosynthesis protein E4